jgi:hypothetical protein
MNLPEAKKVITHDHQGNPNGFLIELDKQGDLTRSYLSCALPGAFKGYHLHRVREANYVCIRGKLAVIMFSMVDGQAHRQVAMLDSSKPTRLHIPIDVATGLWNYGTEEAWIINTPTPAYDPNLKDEQVDFNKDQIDAIYGKFPPFIIEEMGMATYNPRGISKMAITTIGDDPETQYLPTK